MPPKRESLARDALFNAPGGSYDGGPTEPRSDMPKVPDVSAIVESVKARISRSKASCAARAVSDELERLRDALGRLEGAARSRVGGQRDGGRAAALRAAAGRRRARSGSGAPGGAHSAASGKPAGGPARAGRAPRGQNKAKVLEALKGGAKTASEIADATGIATGTVSTLLTQAEQVR